MSNILEKLIARQAASVKKNGELLKLAKQKRDEAAALEAQAQSLPVISELKLEREIKKNRFEQRVANIAAGVKRELYQNMHRNGWVPLIGKDVKPDSFIQKGAPEIVCVVKSGRFSIYKHGEVILSDMHIKNDKMEFVSPTIYIPKAIKK